jgi:hypothetical protein
MPLALGREQMSKNTTFYPTLCPRTLDPGLHKSQRFSNRSHPPQLPRQVSDFQHPEFLSHRVMSSPSPTLYLMSVLTSNDDSIDPWGHDPSHLLRAEDAVDPASHMHTTLFTPSPLAARRAALP